MKVKISSRVLLATLLAIAMLGSLFAPIATAANRLAGEDGYVSLHQYVSKTSDPDTYKVKMHINATNQPTTFDVVFLVDASEKMMSWATTTPDRSHFEYELDAVYDAASILLDPGKNPHMAAGANLARVFVLFYNGNVYGMGAPGSGNVVTLGASLGTTTTNVSYVSNDNPNAGRSTSGIVTADIRTLDDLFADIDAIRTAIKADITAGPASYSHTLLTEERLLNSARINRFDGTGAVPHGIKAYQQHYSAAALAGAYDIFAEYSDVEPGKPNYDEQPPNEGPDVYQNSKNEPVQRKITIMLSADRDFEVRNPLDFQSVPASNPLYRNAQLLEPWNIAQEGSLRAESLAIAKALKYEVHNKAPGAVPVPNGDFTIAHFDNTYIARKGHEATVMGNAFTAIRDQLFTNATGGGTPPTTYTSGAVDTDTSAWMPGYAGVSNTTHGTNSAYSNDINFDWVLHNPDAPPSIPTTGGWAKYNHSNPNDKNRSSSVPAPYRDRPTDADANSTAGTTASVPIGWITDYVEVDTTPTQKDDSVLKNSHIKIAANGGMGAEIWTIGYEAAGVNPDTDVTATSFDHVPATTNAQQYTLSWEGRLVEVGPLSPEYFTDFYDDGTPSNGTDRRYRTISNPSHMDYRQPLWHTWSGMVWNSTGWYTGGTIDVWFTDNYASQHGEYSSTYTAPNATELAGVPTPPTTRNWHVDVTWNNVVTPDFTQTTGEVTSPVVAAATTSGLSLYNPTTGTAPSGDGRQFLDKSAHWPTHSGNITTNHDAANGVTTGNKTMAQFLESLSGTNVDAQQGMTTRWNRHPSTDTYFESSTGWLQTWWRPITNSLTGHRYVLDYVNSSGTNNYGHRWIAGSPPTWANGGTGIGNYDYSNYIDAFKLDFTNETYANAIKEYAANRKDTYGTHPYDGMDYAPVYTFVDSVNSGGAQYTYAKAWNLTTLQVAYQDMVYNLYKIGGGQAVAEVPTQFNIVNPIPEVTYGSNLPERVVTSGGGFTYVVEGNKITWELADKGGIYAATDYFLEFTIKMVPDLDPNLYYSVDDAYLSGFQNRTLFRHKEDRGNYVRYIVDKKFPEKFVKGNGEIVESLDAPALEPQQEYNNLLGFFAIPYGTPTKIAEVKVEEMTLEQTLKDVMSASAYFLKANIK